MKQEKYYRIDDGSSSTMWYIIFGIVAFIVVIFPFFAINMRYQLGAIILKIVDTIGVWSLMVGGALVAISLLGLLTRTPIVSTIFRMIAPN